MSNVSLGVAQIAGKQCFVGGAGITPTPPLPLTIPEIM
jgi:hypothetical protein